MPWNRGEGVAYLSASTDGNILEEDRGKGIKSRSTTMKGIIKLINESNIFPAVSIRPLSMIPGIVYQDLDKYRRSSRTCNLPTPYITYSIVLSYDLALYSMYSEIEVQIHYLN